MEVNNKRIEKVRVVITEKNSEERDDDGNS